MNKIKLQIQACGEFKFYRFRDRVLTPLRVNDSVEYVSDGDLLVMCSGRVTDFVSEDEMEVILANDFEPATGILERARDNGGDENMVVSVTLVGEGMFAPEISEDEYEDDNGRYDAWT